MGRGSNRLTRKVRQRRAQRKKKAALLKKVGAGQNK
jgi:hypothetical protein